MVRRRISQFSMSEQNISKFTLTVLEMLFKKD